MRPMKATAGMLFLLGLILAGCDLAPGANEAASTGVHVDLTALRQASAKHPQEGCAWVAERVDLAVVAGTNTTTFSQRIPEPTSSITMLSVNGMPRRRSRTSLRKELRGS